MSLLDTPTVAEIRAFGEQKRETFTFNGKIYQRWRVYGKDFWVQSEDPKMIIGYEYAKFYGDTTMTWPQQPEKQKSVGYAQNVVETPAGELRIKHVCHHAHLQRALFYRKAWWWVCQECSGICLDTDFVYYYSPDSYLTII